MNEQTPARWASSGRSVIATGLAVVFGLVGLVLSFWPATGLTLLGISIGLLAFGFVMARRARRDLRDARVAATTAIRARTELTM